MGHPGDSHCLSPPISTEVQRCLTWPPVSSFSSLILTPHEHFLCESFPINPCPTGMAQISLPGLQAVKPH